MTKKVLVRGPALTQSGYGEHTRFLLRSLRDHADKFDIFLVAVNWGQTGWLSGDDEERKWFDELIMKTHIHVRQGGQFDVSIQVSIPNEWETIAPHNIGVTAGIETTKVAPAWLERCNMMDKVITISEHSKKSLVESIYEGFHKETNQPLTLKCEVPVHVVHYPVKDCEVEDLNLNLCYDFNYLMVSQWGPRKNLDNSIKWWIEENYDEEVGLIVKTSVKNNSIMDRDHTSRNLKALIKAFLPPESKCKIYLLHGDLSEAQIQSLYTNKKIKTFVTLSHGEGFGLPIFDAVCHGLPVIAPAWSGHCDFLYVPQENGKQKPFFADVNYDIAPVQDFAVWEGVLEKDSMWCFAHEGHYKMRLRQVRKNYNKWLKKAKTLQKWALKTFESKKQHQFFVDKLSDGIDFDTNEDWLNEVADIVKEYQ